MLVASRQDYAIDLLGPARTDQTWQARTEGGYAGAAFSVDWESERMTCPEGHQSVSWTPAVDHKHLEVIKVKFAVEDCRPCPSRSRCTTTSYPRRAVTIRRQAAYEALVAARARDATLRLQGGVRPPCRRGRDTLAGDAHTAPAALPLHRTP